MPVALFQPVEAAVRIAQTSVDAGWCSRRVTRTGRVLDADQFCSLEERYQSAMRMNLVLLALCSSAALAQGPKPKVKPAPTSDTGAGASPNAVQREMQALHLLMVTTLVAIENNTLSAIPTAIHQVHEAKGETEKAITSGSWKPPRADATAADFVKADEAFHGELVKLLQASKKNDVTATTRQLGVVLEGCTSCHVRFRFPH